MASRRSDTQDRHGWLGLAGWMSATVWAADTSLRTALRLGLTAGGVTRAGIGHISKVGNASTRHALGGCRPSVMGFEGMEPRATPCGFMRIGE